MTIYKRARHDEDLPSPPSSRRRTRQSRPHAPHSQSSNAGVQHKRRRVIVPSPTHPASSQPAPPHQPQSPALNPIQPKGRQVEITSSPHFLHQLLCLPLTTRYLAVLLFENHS